MGGGESLDSDPVWEGTMQLIHSCNTADDINPALPSGPQTMGIVVYSSLWVMQDLCHQP